MRHRTWALVSEIGLALTMGVVSGIAINTAHELGHKREENERWLSKIALASSGYGHFYVEHNRGHHVRVATPEDPASSRFGENFWISFLPRTVWGSLRSSWHLEVKRFSRHEQNPWSLRNDILISWAMTIVLFTALCLVFGIGVLPWLVVQAVVGFTLLEIVNYLEHYGLKRGKRDDGRYVAVDPRHSWNADHTVSQPAALPAAASLGPPREPGPALPDAAPLRGVAAAPSGYGTMIVVAVIPPLWRRIMDPKVVAHYDGDLTQANIQPRKRAKILARYGLTESA